MRYEERSLLLSCAASTATLHNLMMRLFVPQIRLQYDAEWRLKSYKGQTNLNVAARQVAIDFTHHTTATKLTTFPVRWLPQSDRLSLRDSDPIY